MGHRTTRAPFQPRRSAEVSLLQIESLDCRNVQSMTDRAEVTVRALSDALDAIEADTAVDVL